MANTSRAYHSPRREQDAQRTHALILESARQLFISHGYARVTMSDIATAAGIAVKTVYASVGTKAAVLENLLAFDASGTGLAQVAAGVSTATGLDASLTLLASCSRAETERLQPSVDLLYASMASDEGARLAWDRVVVAQRDALGRVAERLVTSDLVAAHLGPDAVRDRLWFCFGLAAWRTLIHDCRWNYHDTELFLRRQALCMLTEPDEQ
uniref:TetR/AcrR family transcriptional regulator n=1 Tax=Paractinoplanes polyasparticus TaxID=2856853 RepID=UPI001C85BC76|nr:TetR/AcrR family transcriptional regulator [Actinoplanes polyasparticus]